MLVLPDESSAFFSNSGLATREMLMFTQEQLKEVLHYDPETGGFTWLKSFGRKAKVGEKAGSSAKNRNTSYIQIQINKKRYLAHRLAWIYVYGFWPHQIDHIDGNGLNNKIKNLRNCNALINCKNQAIRKANTSGVIGVWYHNQNKNWCAEIKVNYKKICLGSFKNKCDAISARKKAEVEYGFHENHGRKSLACYESYREAQNG